MSLIANSHALSSPLDRGFREHFTSNASSVFLVPNQCNTYNELVLSVRALTIELFGQVLTFNECENELTKNCPEIVLLCNNRSLKIEGAAR